MSFLFECLQSFHMSDLFQIGNLTCRERCSIVEFILFPFTGCQKYNQQKLYAHYKLYLVILYCIQFKWPQHKITSKGSVHQIHGAFTFCPYSVFVFINTYQQEICMDPLQCTAGRNQCLQCPLWHNCQPG